MRLSTAIASSVALLGEERRIVGSWCGKKFRGANVAARPGWADVPAVANGELHEIKSCDILQPGPAALTDGVEQLHWLCAAWAVRQGAWSSWVGHDLVKTGAGARRKNHWHTFCVMC